jgi:hypothetical protein
MRHWLRREEHRDLSEQGERIRAGAATRQILSAEREKAEDRRGVRRGRGRSTTRASSSSSTAAATPSARFIATLRQRDAEAGALFRLRAPNAGVKSLSDSH